MLKTTSQAKTYVLAHPHLGTLDNWMPVIKEMHIASNNTKFTLMVKNLTTIRSYNKKNAVVSISNDIFDEVLIHAYKEFWIRKTSVFEAINWYKKTIEKTRNSAFENTDKSIYAAMEEECSDEPSSLLMVPYLAGTGTPYMDSKQIYPDT